MSTITNKDIATVSSTESSKLASIRANANSSKIVSISSDDDSSKLVVMERAGATREAAWSRVTAGLTAKKITIDKAGYEHIEEDTANQLRSSEIILRASGDIKPDGATINNINITPSVSVDDLARFREFVSRQSSRDVSKEQSGEIIDVQSYSE